MSNKNSAYFKGAIWLGLLVLIPVTALLFVLLRADSQAPRWVVITFLMMFFNAGLTLLLLDPLFNEIRKEPWFAYFQTGALLSIPLLVAILLNWVAFGPGARGFSGSVSIPIFAISFGRADEIFGRVIFGIPAMFLDIIVDSTVTSHQARFAPEYMGVGALLHPHIFRRKPWSGSFFSEVTVE